MGASASVANQLVSHQNGGMKASTPPNRTSATAGPNVGRTMKAARMRKKEAGTLTIIKAGELVEASFDGGASLSSAARKVLLRMLLIAAGDAWEDKTFSLAKRDFRTGGHNADDRLLPALKELRKIEVRAKVLSPRGKSAETFAPLLVETTHEIGARDDHLVYWRFSETARRVMKDSNRYAEIEAAAVFALHSRYAVTLFEVGSLYHRREDPVWRGTVDELRALLGVEEGAYANWADLRRFTLERAKREIEAAATFGLEWSEIRHGRVVKRVELEFPPLSEEVLGVYPAPSKPRGKARPGRDRGARENDAAIAEAKRLREEAPRKAAQGLRGPLRDLLVQPGIPGLDDD